MSTVVEIQAAIETLSFKERAELERWLRAGPGVPVRPSDLNPEEDTPELEAELLKAVNGPHVPLRKGDLRKWGNAVLRRRKAGRGA
jgi:hypothetical protein